MGKKDRILTQEKRKDNKLIKWRERVATAKNGGLNWSQFYKKHHMREPLLTKIKSIFEETK